MCCALAWRGAIKGAAALLVPTMTESAKVESMPASGTVEPTAMAPPGSEMPRHVTSRPRLTRTHAPLRVSRVFSECLSVSYIKYPRRYAHHEFYV